MAFTQTVSPRQNVVFDVIQLLANIFRSFASVKNAYAIRPDVCPVAFNRKESPGQLQTVQLVTKAPFPSA